MILFITLIALILFIIVQWINVIWDSKKLKVPGPFPLPVIGNGHWMFGDSSTMVKNFQYLWEKYGSVARLYIIGSQYILISDPKLVEALTSSTEFLSKGKSYDFLHMWLGQGLLTSTGSRWKNHRKFLTPAFHFNILQNFLPIFIKNGKILVEKLHLKSKKGEPIDLFPIVALAALDNVTESIMGVTINAQSDSESEYVNAIKEMSNILAYRMRNLFAAIDPIYNLTPTKKHQDEVIKVLHGQSNKVIEQRRNELENSKVANANTDSDLGIKSKHAFLDLLLLAETDGQKIDDVSIREEVDTFMFEGHDTTTTGIVFCLYSIGNHPKVQEKILQEQLSILGNATDRDPTYTEIQQMKYLECVIKESLRLYPSVPYFERKINRDTELAGLFVPKDTSILVDVFDMHRDPKLFENPLEFIPERFESNENRHPFSYLAFSAGPRNCIGQKFAMVSIKVTVAAIVRNFKIFPAGPEPILKADLVLGSLNGVHVALEKR